jgi:hypothetical protein
MAIVVSCNQCGQRYQVADTAAGTRKKCMKCEAPMTVPSRGFSGATGPAPARAEPRDPLASAAALEATSYQSDPLGPAYSPAGNSNTRVLMIAGGVIGGVALLLAVVAVVFLAATGGSGSDDMAEASAAVEDGRFPQPMRPSSTGPRPSSYSPAVRPQATTPGGRFGEVAPAIDNRSVSPSRDPSLTAPVSSSAPRPASGSTASGSAPAATVESTTFKNASTAPPTRVAWSVEVDPPHAPPEAVQIKPGLELPIHERVDLVTADPLTRHAVLISDVSRHEGFRTIDLQTGATKEVLLEPAMYYSRVLRGDGRYVAGADRIRRRLQVVALPDGAETIIEAQNGQRFEDLKWLADGRLLGLQTNHRELQLDLYDIDSGKQTTLTIPSAGGSEYLERSLAVSPGGRYAALVTGGDLVVYELSTGQPVGNKPLLTDRDSTWAKCGGLCFSHDGTRLAVCWEKSSELYLRCWDVTSGESLLEKQSTTAQWGISSLSRTDDYLKGGGPGLTWLPGTFGWLLHGMHLIDGASGMRVWTVSNGEDWCMPTGSTTYLRFERQADRVKYLTEHTVPTEELAKRIGFLRGGGLMADFGLPPLTEVSATIRKIGLQAAPVSWKYQADPSVWTPQALSKPVRLAFDEMPQRILAARNADRVIALGADESRLASRTIHRLRTNGEQEPDVELPAPFKLLAVSPTGDFFLLGSSASSSSRSDRLDLWSSSTGEAVAAWRPYSTSSGKPDTVDEAIFFDDQHVLTCFSTKNVVWKLPECQPVYQFTDATFIDLSPGGKYAIWYDSDGWLLFCDPRSGQCHGKLEVGGYQRDLQITFNPAANSLACLNASGLTFWDLATGEKQESIGLPYSVSRKSLRWLNDRYMLAGNTLIDRPAQVPVWSYAFELLTPVKGIAGDRAFYVATDLKRELPGCYLTEVRLPTAAALQEGTRLRPEDVYILGPGGTASLSISCSVPGVDTTELRRRAIETLERNLVTVSDTAPVRISLSGSHGYTGRTNTYESWGIRAQRKTFQVREQSLHMQMTVTDDKGRSWDRTREWLSSGAMFERGDIEQNIADRLRSSFERFAIDIPTHVYPSDGGFELGESRISLRGERVK